MVFSLVGGFKKSYHSYPVIWLMDRLSLRDPALRDEAISYPNLKGLEDLSGFLDSHRFIREIASVAAQPRKDYYQLSYNFQVCQ
jgi:hypothetical protein